MAEEHVRALWFTGAGRAVIREESLPPPGEGWCEIQTLYSTVSAGTERLVFSGRVPESQWGEMRCPYMGGSFSFPVKYGYSLVGRVIQGPADLLDRTVHVMHPHQTHCLVRTEDLHRIPETVPPHRAVLASNLETAVNAVWDARVNLGERILVVGFGSVGSLVARVLSLTAGLQVVVADRDPAKVALARSMWFQACLPREAPDNFDAAFHASGSPEGLQLALDRVGLEGRVVELSWYGTHPVTLDLGGAFHSRRKSLISSQVARIPAHLGARWDHHRRRDLVWALLERPEFESHLTQALSFEALPEFFERHGHGSMPGLSLLVEYGR
ncbi:MAG: dehydrogenase [Candidatus Zixiibacteriota bacterium]|nr:MAG: dehydrogenase [candidate division Zixibacteria bacterium]